MHTFLMILHVLVCLVLILVVLLQRGKGSDMGAALGGGSSQTVFGSRGAGNFLTKLTTAAAIGFMLTSLSLSYLTTQEANVLVFDEEVLDSAPSPDAASPDALEEVDVDASEGASADELVEMELGESGDAAPAEGEPDGSE